MTRAKTFLLILAVVGLSAGAALGQATTTYVPLSAWIVDRDNGNSADPNETHYNAGGDNSSTRVWARVEQYYGDWDVPTMATEITALDLGSYCYTTPVYKLEIGIAALNGYPVAPDYANIRVSSLWSTNDWVEGDGPTNYANYNWTNPTGSFAATHMYAQDIEGLAGAELPWHFPGNQQGMSQPEQDCNFWGTFVPLDPMDDGYATSTHPWIRSLENTAQYQLDSSDHDTMVSIVLDQAMIDDLLTNDNNRGLILDAFQQPGMGGSPNNKRGVYMKSHQGGAWAMNITAGFDVCSGDGNLDCAVDGLDYVAWSNNYLDPNMGWQGGDFNQDGLTDGLDYVVWSNNYLATCPGVPGAVPEPATLALLAIGGLALLKRRR